MDAAYTVTFPVIQQVQPPSLTGSDVGKCRAVDGSVQQTHR